MCSRAGKVSAACVCLALAVAGGFVRLRADAPVEPLSAETRARLLAGEVILERRDAGDRGADARVSILIRAPVERVWAVMVTCAHAYAYLAGLRECRVLEERGDFALTHQVVDKGWWMPRLDYTFETRRIPYRSMEIHLVDGNLERLDGSWTFRKLDEGLLVRHEIVLQPKAPAPRWLVRRNVVRDLPDMLRCIRAAARGSGAADIERADRAACAIEPPPVQ